MLVNTIMFRRQMCTQVFCYFINRCVNLTDNEGARTRSAIPNKHGIVKFEINRVYTDDRQVCLIICFLIRRAICYKKCQDKISIYCLCIVCFFIYVSFTIMSYNRVYFSYRYQRLDG